MDKKDFVTYEQALKLKELGFREDCLHTYKDDGVLSENCYSGDEVLLSDLYYSENAKGGFENICDAPTLAQAQKWFRKAKGWDIYAYPTNAKNNMKMYCYGICYWNNPDAPEYGSDSEDLFDSYEEALSAGISECIKLLEK